MDKSSFIILTWTSAKVISPCLESIASIHTPDYEIITVDNGSNDGTTAKIDAFIAAHPQIAVKKLELEKNYGTTVSRNLGIQKTADDTNYVCILDSDTVINQDAVSELISVLKENEKNAIAGPHMVNLCGEEQVTAKKIPTAML